MKKNRSILSLAIVASIGAALACGVIGCGNVNPLSQTRDVFLVKKPGPIVTNEVQIFNSEDIEIPATTNKTTGVIDPGLVKSGAKPIRTDTVLVQLPPTYENGPNVANAQAVASTIPVYGGLASVSIGLLAAVSKLWLNRKRLPIITSTFQTIDDFTNALIATGDEKNIALAKKLKEALSTAHNYAEVAPQVQALIDAYTGSSQMAAEISKLAKP